jgi:hypothetical protein
MTVIMEENAVGFGQATQGLARLLERLQDRIEKETVADSYGERLVLILELLAYLLGTADWLLGFGIYLCVESGRVGIDPAFQSGVGICSNDVGWFSADVKAKAQSSVGRA